MKALDFIKEMQDLVDEFGNLDVGINNPEFNSFDSVHSVYYKKAETESDSYWNNDDVGDDAYFIAID